MSRIKIEEALTEYWGPRCPDHEPDCFTCQAWAELDKLVGDAATADHLLRRARAVLNISGHYDTAELIHNFLEDNK